MGYDWRADGEMERGKAVTEEGSEKLINRFRTVKTLLQIAEELAPNNKKLGLVLGKLSYSCPQKETLFGLG
jgi:hypothetical protein